MSSCDSKHELGALFRMEFYKKQNKWKLSTKRPVIESTKKQHKKPVEKNEKKPIQNTTYCSMECEVSDQLNVAFVEAEKEQIQTQPNSSKNIQLSQEWLEPVNNKPPEIDSENKYGTPNTNQNIRGEVLKHVEKCPTCNGTGGTTPGRKSVTERMEELLKLHRYEEEKNNLMKKMDGRDADLYCCTDYDEELSLTPALVLSEGDVASDDWDADAELASEAVGGYCSDELYSGTWTQLSIISDLPSEFEQVAKDSFDMSAVDSFGEFCRGAHAAPHSSEIDLTLPSWLDVPRVGFASLACLSSKQLLHAVDLHTRLVRKLLMENEHKQLLRASARLARDLDDPTCYSGWDEPTYDPGLLLPLPGLGAGCPGPLPLPGLWADCPGPLLLPGLEAGCPGPLPGLWAGCPGRGRGRLPRPDLCG